MENKSETGLLQGNVDVAAVHNDSIDLNDNECTHEQKTGCDIDQQAPCGSPHKHESLDIFHDVSSVHDKSSSILNQTSGAAVDQEYVTSLAREHDSLEGDIRESEIDDVIPMFDVGESPTLVAIHQPSTPNDHHSQSSLSTSVCKFVATTINGVSMLFNTVTKEYFVKLPKEESDRYMKLYNI